MIEPDITQAGDKVRINFFDEGLNLRISVFLFSEFWYKY